MNLRALLLCDDVRLEVDGTITLIGVRNERLRVPPSPGPLVLQSLIVVVVIGGLTGCDRISYRGRIHHIEDAPPERPLSHEARSAANGEHNLVFAYTPMVIERLGTYEVVVDIEAAARAATYRHRFHVEA